jgi:hypothetical protein
MESANENKQLKRDVIPTKLLPVDSELDSRPTEVIHDGIFDYMNDSSFPKVSVRIIE